MVEPDIKLYHFAMGQGRPVLIVHGGPGRPRLKPWAGLAPLTSRASVRAFPTAQFHVIQNAGHFPFHTQPTEFGLAVAGFLNRSGAIL